MRSDNKGQKTSNEKKGEQLTAITNFVSFGDFCYDCEPTNGGQVRCKAKSRQTVKHGG
jgi:hypothetical protein